MKLTIYRDNTPTIQVQTFHNDGSVVDLTGCAIEMCFKMDQAQTNAQSAFIKSTDLDSGITITDAPNGVFEAVLLTSDTQQFNDTTILYTDVLITDSAGKVFTVANTTTLEVKANYSRK
jgi:hypothetical protein